MHLEILSEDRSGGVMLSTMLQTLRRKRSYDFTFSIRPHRGKGYLPKNAAKPPPRDALGLQDLLAAKARAYARVLDPDTNILIIVMDSDSEPYQRVESHLKSLLLPYISPLRYVIGMCTEEMEAWLLGDHEALRQAYPQTDWDCVMAYRQDSVCGTWEWLARCVDPENAERIIRIGYPAVGHFKQEWCTEISRHMDPDRNRSPSFQRFLHRLEKMIGKLENEQDEANDDNA